jgi:Methyltransferase domain
MLSTFLTDLCACLTRRLTRLTYICAPLQHIPFKGIPRRTINCTLYVRTGALMRANHSRSHVNLSLPGDFFIPAFQCPHHVERIGTLGDGGKWVCGVDRIAKQDKCVIYSFGLPIVSIGRVLIPLLCEI